MKKLYLAFALFTFTFSLSAADIHVETTGDDDTGDGSAAKPYLTFEKGVAAAADGDTVLLGDGDFPVAAWLVVEKAITIEVGGRTR